MLFNSCSKNNVIMSHFRDLIDLEQIFMWLLIGWIFKRINIILRILGRINFILKILRIINSNLRILRGINLMLRILRGIKLI